MKRLAKEATKTQVCVIVQILRTGAGFFLNFEYLNESSVAV
jgi:hypothetical protein